MTSFDYQDKVAIVTGGASGIGRALGFELGARGARVVIADIAISAADAVACELARGGSSASAIHVDVRVAGSVSALVDACVARHGRVDYLFASAGVPIRGDVCDISSAEWQDVFDTNVWGVVHGIGAALPRMLRQRSGHIVAIASAAALAPSPVAVPYAASKAAVVAACEALRIECADTGVRVSVACPGFVETPFLAKDIDFLRRFGSIMSPRECAARILSGVARGEAVITFPASVRLHAWLCRVAPALAFRLNVFLSRKLRKARTGSEELAIPSD